MMNEEQAIFVHNCLQMIGFSVLYYDYYLTFPQEFFYIWRRGGRANTSTYWFFLNRYLSLFGDIVVAVMLFQRLSPESCTRYHLFRQLLLLASQVVVFFVMFIRTYALYNRSKRVLWFIASSGIVLFSLSCWGMIGQHPALALSHGCTVGFARVTGIHLAVPYEAQFAMDTIICALTLYRTWKLSKHNGSMGIMGLMLRDGAMYFGTMALANGANVATFYINEPLLRGGLSTFAGAVSVSMCSRMILNLHETAHIERHLTVTAAHFTTRFEPAAQLTHWDDDDSTQRDSASLALPDPLLENAKPWVMDPESYWEV